MDFQYIPLEKLPAREKTILLRIDGNVPFKNKQILDDFKLQQVLPTIEYLMRQNTCIIILTHLGNPKEPSDDFSTKILLPWFLKNYKNVHFVNNLELLKTMPKNIGEIILFENVRFFKESSSCQTTTDGTSSFRLRQGYAGQDAKATADDTADRTEKMNFAKELAQNADFFINDAFGTIHRDDATISILPQLFDYNHRSLGFLIEKEINQAEKIWQNRPIILIVGGGKAESKRKYIEEDVNNVDKILLCPLISSSFAKATADRTADMPADKTLEMQKKYVFPVDYVIERIINNKKTIMEIAANELLSDDTCISIGQKTIALFKNHLENAGTIIWNGYMGFLEQKETLFASEQLARLIYKTKAYIIIAGSDTGYFARHVVKTQNKNIFFSTGGGALLAYIAEKENLPGLMPFTKTN